MTGAPGPCDIYQSADTPCVAAHSTVRALYGEFSGNLYQVRRASDQTTQDIAVLSPGGYADSAAQDSFCSDTTCTISIIYDQSPNGNHLTKSPPGGWLNNGGLEADATAAQVTVGGHTVYGVYTTMNWDDDIGATRSFAMYGLFVRRAYDCELDGGVPRRPQGSTYQGPFFRPDARPEVAALLPVTTTPT